RENEMSSSTVIVPYALWILSALISMRLFLLILSRISYPGNVVKVPFPDIRSPGYHVAAVHPCVSKKTKLAKFHPLK
ncbi:MAG: hypothetical protein ACP5IC_02870, partial [Minisyncoccia bacterium]